MYVILWRNFSLFGDILNCQSQEEAENELLFEIIEV